MCERLAGDKLEAKDDILPKQNVDVKNGKKLQWTSVAFSGAARAFKLQLNRL